MKQMSHSTPCPAPVAGSSSQRWSTSSTHNTVIDDTAQIEYTQALESTLKSRKPRHSSLVHSKTARNAVPVTVFEQVDEDEELVIGKPQGKAILFSKPARKMAGSTAVGSGEGKQIGVFRKVGQARARPSVGGVERASVHIEQKLYPVSRRVPNVATNGAVCTSAGSDAVPAGSRSRPEDIFGPAFKKQPRRKTIYIPEDTTVFTIHPGASTTARLDDTFNIEVSNFHDNHEEKESHISKPIRRPRMSLPAAPRRPPLFAVRGPEADNVGSFDVCGDNTGKENVPPMGQKTFKGQTRNSPEGIRYADVRAHAPVMQPTVTIQNRPINASRPAPPVPKTRTQELRAAGAQSSAAVRSTSSSLGRISVRHALDAPRSRLASVQAQPLLSRSEKRETLAAVDKGSLRQHIEMRRMESQSSKLSLYPVLPENLSQPELYEDSWLSQQEIALTEVVNEIFAGVERSKTISNAKTSIREEMIALYHRPEVSMLYRRLQASVMYGALSKPKDNSQSTDPDRDIGLRRKFVSLFLDNYAEGTLYAAAEVIVGRQIPKRNRSCGNAVGENTLDPHAGRRAFTGFFQTFFISPADIDTSDIQRDGSEKALEKARWEKSVLRCIMLIWLLDQGKSSEHICGCLFKQTASKKSSSAILLAFTAMMVPSVGDITRALRQMDFMVSHVQDPLDEIVYRIDNLAVDMRSGIMITHLVETLLYCRQNIPSHFDEGETTVTVRLPDSTQLQSDMYNADMALNTRLISQHLKIPCVSRVQKLFNVQIALSTLEGYNVHGANVVGDITAEDVVNGHREKTLSLLWSLVSVFGLDHLIDFQYVQADTRRTYARHGSPALNIATNNGVNDPSTLLQDWAASHAIDCDTTVTNLTTSFANGKVFAAIVDDFSCFLPTSSNDFKCRPSLESRLLALGCSTAFTRQLTCSLGSIPSRETTVSNLAFLASRLLPLARNHEAAITLQRAYRNHRTPVVISQRIALMRLAHQCAEVIQVQQQTLSAAITIQRAWRAVAAARIMKLSVDVASFQVLARG